ncbi:protein CHROMATIN REMODELING 35-like [Impatiens glandulifera]|uniref:protein CHROMATIN REMODELING 35-like n=1 Tax=Impatiens glandulifera TaxID=253017 RepID=UPI001FB08100|nr:protein CHROMATIN REMODELING 35-like [Impatiens glandulifera]
MMESALELVPLNYAPPISPMFQPLTPHDSNLTGHKRVRTSDISPSTFTYERRAKKNARTVSEKVIEHSDPFAVRAVVEKCETGEYGSVTKELKGLLSLNARFRNKYYALYPEVKLKYEGVDVAYYSNDIVSLENPASSSGQTNNVIDLDGDEDVVVVASPSVNNVKGQIVPLVIIDSDEEEPEPEPEPEPDRNKRLLCPFQEVALPKSEEFLMKNYLDMSYPPRSNTKKIQEKSTARPSSKKIKEKSSHVGPSIKKEDVDQNLEEEYKPISIKKKSKKDKGVYAGMEDDELEEPQENEAEKEKDKGVYVGVEDDELAEHDESESEQEDLSHIWTEMTVALECSKVASVDPPPTEEHVQEEGDDCDHDFILKDDIGYVCCICGVIQRKIETIIEYQYAKSSRSGRTSKYEPRTSKEKESIETTHDGVKYSGKNFIVAEMFAHPRHSKQMKPHQVEGFNFLLSNLMADEPGGCIMAHAPGSGKTFMIISFIQSFMAKYPLARPLVILPKGILTTWKKEFQRWQIEDLPLFDFYSVKADSRTQQLEVLKQWASVKSILFLGYKQFSTIVTDDERNKVAAACQEILLTYPSILILDEGHTPRNENTDVLNSLRKIQTPRKVVLSGTLYQNHVKEVFNIFDLVRPKFLKTETSRSIIRRILSRVPSVRRHVKAKGLESVFFESVELALQKDENFKRKTTVIQDLREMTRNVLHYYRGDFLDELPGLIDFTVFLHLTPSQKLELEDVRNLVRRFTISSHGSALYVHPKLKTLLKSSSNREQNIDDVRVDQLLEKIDLREGVKAKFFLNLISLCESANEKLLVFSQYLPPLKCLERLAVKEKGWSMGKELFVITGDSSTENREWSMDCFNNSPDARVFFGSIKACGEGISLVGASRILILDVHLNPSVTRQAIGRAFRPGQEKKVYVYRLVAAESPEEEDHMTCFMKESIAKMWFEWNEYGGKQEFAMETVDITNCGDQFLESPKLMEDIKSLYRRLVGYLFYFSVLNKI